jgi:acyl dehydratase
MERFTRPGLSFSEFAGQVGQELGVSDWVIVDQERINRFADCTGDRQWIHVDPDHARRRSPLRTTIAHGYLSLSLVATLGLEMRVLPETTQAAFNHGLKEVRFIAPVKSGARVRLRTLLLGLESLGPRQYLMHARNVLEIEGEAEPALVADAIVKLYEAHVHRRQAAVGA